MSINDKIAAVKGIVEKTPTISIRRLAQQVNLSKSATQKILRDSLKLHLHKIQYVQFLSSEPQTKRKAFSEWFIEKCAYCPTFHL